MSKQGKVVKVLSPLEVVVDIGNADGVGTSSRFLVFRHGEEIKDPDTNESLGILEIVRGRGEAKHVQEHLTTVRSIERRVERRDRVRQRLVGQFERLIQIAPAESEMVTEEVEVLAPFEQVQTGDLVRVL